MLLQQLHHLFTLLPRKQRVFLAVHFGDVLESAENVPRHRRIIKKELQSRFVALQLPELIFQPILPLVFGLEAVDDCVEEVLEKSVLVSLHRFRAAFRREDLVDLCKITHFHSFYSGGTAVDEFFGTIHGDN